MAEENRSWGYDRVVGALANLEHEVSDQTVGNVLRRHGIPPASERNRRTTWAEFIRIHLALHAGTDISAAEVLMRGLVTCYVLFFIYLESYRIDISRLTNCPLETTSDSKTCVCGDAVPDSAAMLYSIVTRYTSLPSKRPEPRLCEV
jgi:putative transposase